MLQRRSQHRALWLLVLSAASATAALASDPACPCSTYLWANGFNAMVVDNESGWVEYVDAAMSHEIERAPVFKVRPRASALGWVVTDCSVERVPCVEIHHRSGKETTVLAFKPGAAGDTYSVRGVKFEILSAGTLADTRPASRKVYWVEFTASAPRRSGNFVYVEGTGVVRYESAEESAYRKPGGAIQVKPMLLVDGPGLLSQNGFPKQR